MNMKLEQAAEQIKDAEVIVIYGNPELSIDPANPMDWNCGQGSNVFYVNSCEMETFNLYIQHLEEIYAKIFELREGQPTIIRAFDAYNPVIPRETAQEGYQACLACWANYNAAIHQAAETFNVPVAKVAEAWNGADGTEDPVAKGYTKDNIHPNELGAKVIAEALRDLGYEPVYPPK
jgi:hypothetical protein